MKTKTIKINGIKTKVILPNKINQNEIPNELTSKKSNPKGKFIKEKKEFKMKKDLFKMNKEEIQEEIWKQEIETKKTELDRYIETIVKYAFTDVCTAGAFFNMMFKEQLAQGFKIIKNSKLTEDEKSKLSRKLLFYLDHKPTEEELHKDSLEYYNKQIWWAKHELNDLSKEKKKEIITDCIKQMNLWDNQFDKTCKINKEIGELEKKK